MQNETLQHLFLASLILAVMLVGASVFAQQTHEQTTLKMNKQDFRKNNSSHVAKTERKAKKQLPAVEMVKKESASGVKNVSTKVERGENISALTTKNAELIDVTTPPITVDAPTPTVEYKIVDAPVTRTSEAVGYMVREGLTDRQARIYGLDGQELQALYEKARPATQAKILADPVLKQRLEAVKR